MRATDGSPHLAAGLTGKSSGRIRSVSLPKVGLSKKLAVLFNSAVCHAKLLTYEDDEACERHAVNGSEVQELVR